MQKLVLGGHRRGVTPAPLVKSFDYPSLVRGLPRNTSALQAISWFSYVGKSQTIEDFAVSRPSQSLPICRENRRS